MSTTRDPLRGLRPAAPPLALRDRVLRAARAATAERIAHRPPFPRLELTWTATLLLTLLGHLAVDLLAGQGSFLVFRPADLPAVRSISAAEPLDSEPQPSRRELP